jgi:hypothetical protein
LMDGIASPGTVVQYSRGRPRTSIRYFSSAPGWRDNDWKSYPKFR